jgi:hypothetical protein
MLVQVNKFIVKSYGELLKENFETILADIVLLIMTVSSMFAADSLLNGMTITLFEITYSLDILVFYLLGFIFILTTGSLFKEMRHLLNLVSRFVISRFPRMHGNYSPGKAILRDLVQVIVLMLTFYPVSELIENVSYRGFSLSYMVSMSFLLITLIFAYDVTSNIIKIVLPLVQGFISKLFALKAEAEEVQA